MQIGHLKQKANPIVAWFVMCCCIVTVGLLYLMQKTYAAADNIAANADYSTYLQE